MWDDRLLSKPLRNLTCKKNDHLWSIKTAGKEPYVPFLLLSMLDLFGRKKINSHCITISDDLVAQFTMYCLSYDADSQVTSHFVESFHRLEQFKTWTISFRKGQGDNGHSGLEISSITKLKELVYGTQIPKDLFPLLTMETSRNKIYTTIFTTYFSADFSGFLIKRVRV